MGEGAHLRRGGQRQAARARGGGAEGGGVPGGRSDAFSPMGDERIGSVRDLLHLVRASRGLRLGAGDFRSLRWSDHPAGKGDARGLGRGPHPDPADCEALREPPGLLPLLCPRNLRGVHRPLSCGRHHGGGARQGEMRAAPEIDHGGVREIELRLRWLRVRPVPDGRSL